MSVISKKNDELRHYGIKGQRWGIRRYQNKDGSLTSAGKKKYYEESNTSIIINKDGSKSIPKGFKFNRIGQEKLDVNASGGLYVSYGKDDAARYIKNLGPTKLNKLLGVRSNTVQHISVKDTLKMPSDNEVVKETANLLLSNKKLLNSLNDSIYSMVVSDRGISSKELCDSLSNPNNERSVKIAYSVSSFLGDPKYTSESKILYEHFRNKGYDAIPDLHDRLSGTSKTAMIIINPNKVEITSKTTITKDVLKAGKQHVKSIEKLKINDLIK